MGLEPISIKNMEEKTNDLYEAVVVMSKKAKQVINERTMEKLMLVSDQAEMGVFDDEENINPEDYEELTKPTTVAVDSFVNGDLEWTKKLSELVLIKSTKSAFKNLIKSDLLIVVYLQSSELKSEISKSHILSKFLIE
mgnify:CR=1 FL=1